MPIIANQNVYTLTQWANSLGPDHMIQTRVANLLEQQNGVIADAGWIESNMPLGHMGEVQVGLPASYYAAMNGFVGVSQDAVMPIQEPAAMLKAFTQVSKEMGELGGMGELAKLRARKSKAQLESFNQQFTKTLFYGSAVNPASFVGLSTRYSSLEATNGQNILDAGGTSGTNASIWLVVWGEETCTMFFPKGSKAGIDHRDLGLQTLQSINTSQFSDTNTGLLEVYREAWTWKHGLFLNDWRYVVRIANIDVPKLLAKTGADVLDLLLRATHHVPNLHGGRPAIYMNRTLLEMLDVAKRDAVKEGGQLKYEVVDGIEIPTFRGIPVRIVDQLLNTEARVV
jgi:hypothetical protein